MTGKTCVHCGSRRVIKVWPAADEASAPSLFLQRNCLDCFRMFRAPWPPGPEPQESPMACQKCGGPTFGPTCASCKGERPPVLPTSGVEGTPIEEADRLGRLFLPRFQKVRWHCEQPSQLVGDTIDAGACGIRYHEYPGYDGAAGGEYQCGVRLAGREAKAAFVTSGRKATKITFESPEDLVHVARECRLVVDYVKLIRRRGEAVALIDAADRVLQSRSPVPPIAADLRPLFTEESLAQLALAGDGDIAYSLRTLAHLAKFAEVAAILREAAGRLESGPSPGSLTFAAFSAANLRRCEAPDAFHHAIESWSLSDWFVAVIGELGEAANVVKKLNRVRDGIPGNKEGIVELRAKFRREVGDAGVYLDLIAQSQGFLLGDAMAEAFDAKSAEIGYPERLSPEAP